MQPVFHKEVWAKEAKTSIKEESELRPLNNIPRQSTIAQFIKSGKAAFGSAGPKLLSEHDEPPGEVQKWMLDQVHVRLAAASDLYHDDIQILRSLLKLEYSNNTTGFQFLFPPLSRLMRSNLTCAVTFTNSVLDASTNEVPRTTKDNLLRGIAQILGSVSIDMRNNEKIERQLAGLEEKKLGDSSEPRPLAKLSPAALGIFTKHFYGTGLYDPIESMLARLQSEMDHAIVTDLHTIYVPFLQELIGLMLMYGIPLTNVTYRRFFESVLQSYCKRFIGQEPSNSLEHKSWKQRADAALGTLESFDHSYFREILGERYDTDVLPTLMKVQGLASVTQTRDRFDSLTTAGETGAKTPGTPVTS